MSITNKRAVESILNLSGDFDFIYQGTTIPLHGFLSEENSTVVFRCHTDSCFVEDFLKSNEKCQINGIVAGQKITMIDCYHIVAQFDLLESEKEKVQITISFIPDYIIVGINTHQQILTTSITLHTEELISLFSEPIFHNCFEFPHKMLHLPRFSPPKGLSADYENSSIEVNRTYRTKIADDSISFVEEPYIMVSYQNPTNIQTAIENIHMARNLFSFFADYYLPISELNFEPPNVSCICTIILNHTEIIESPSLSLFLVNEEAIKGAFTQIWSKWHSFCTSCKPIVTLFYEVITHHSTRINRFLNLCQCLEVYSKHNRNSNAWKVYRKYSNIKSKYPTLKHRLEDLFLFVNRHIGLSDSECIEIAEAISDARNYFTHYSKNKTEPSFECITYSNIYLRFVLLVLIYMMLGIEDQYIDKCKIREYSKIKEYTRFIRNM